MRLRARTVLATLSIGLGFATCLAVALPAPASAQATTPATPVCPGGAEFNPSTGQCERPAVLECPSGWTLEASRCQRPVTCPPGWSGPNRGSCTDPATNTVNTASCPSGSSSVGIQNACYTDPVWACPRAFTKYGQLCSVSPTYKCAAGATLSGKQCVQSAAPAAAPTAARGATPAATPSGAGRPSRLGLQLAATGDIAGHAVGVAGVALMCGGVLLLLSYGRAASARR